MRGARPFPNLDRFAGSQFGVGGFFSDIPGSNAVNIESDPQRTVRQNYRCGTLILNTGERPSVPVKYTAIYPGLQA